MKKEEEASSSCVTLLREEFQELQRQQEKRRRRRKLQELAKKKAGMRKNNSINGNLANSGILKRSFSNCTGTVLPSLPENDACCDSKVLPWRRQGSGSIVRGYSKDDTTINNLSGDDSCCYFVDQARSFSCSQDDSCTPTARGNNLSSRNHLVPETSQIQQFEILFK